MRDNIKLYITVSVAWLVLLTLFVAGVGLVHAQDNGDTSISGSYDYTNEEVDYSISGDLRDPYNLESLEQSQSADTVSGITDLQYTDPNEVTVAHGSEVSIYSLSSEYDLSTRTEQSTFEPLNGTSEEGGTIRGIEWVANGNKFSVAGGDSFNTGIFVYNTSTAYDFDSPQLDSSTSFQFSYEHRGLAWLNDNTVVSARTSGYLDLAQCSDNYVLESCTNFNRQLDNRSNYGTIQTIEINRNTSEFYFATDNGEIGMGQIDGTDGPYNDVLVNNDEFLDTNIIDWADNGNTLIGSDSNTAARYDANPSIDTWLSDNTGSEIENTRQTINTYSGSISASPDTYEQVTVNYQNNYVPDESGESNAISIYGDGEIDIREEQTNNIITESVNVTAYGEESGIYSLETSDGTIDITDLPDQSYTFAVSSTGYYQRVRYVGQLGNADNFYLLDNTTDTVTSQFTLEDRTGVYDQDSRLVIRRSIEGNGNDWQTIISDSFGSEGLTLDLQENVRYRLYVETDNQMQLIGPYRASISETVTVSPTSGEIGVGEGEYWSAGAQYNNQAVNVRFIDPTNQTDSVSVSIYERGNESNTLVTNDQYTSPSELQLEYPVSNQYNETNWIVELTVTRGSETYTTSFNVGPTADIVPTELDDFWRKIVAVLLMLTFGMVFSIRNKAVGSIVYACVGGMFYWIGLLEGLTTAGLVVAYFFIVIIYNIYMKS